MTYPQSTAAGADAVTAAVEYRPNLMIADARWAMKMGFLPSRKYPALGPFLSCSSAVREFR
jgi:hypothetical protein